MKEFSKYIGVDVPKDRGGAVNSSDGVPARRLVEELRVHPVRRGRPPPAASSRPGEAESVRWACPLNRASNIGM
jgi:hypothetical protein